MSAFDMTRCKRPFALAFLTVGLATLTAASAAVAAPTTDAATGTDTSASVAPDVKKGFDELDTNSDGKISRQEAEADTVLSKNFARFDRNKDGMVSLTEFDRFAVWVNAVEPSLTTRTAARVRQ
jgi:hypothetical protein